MIITRTPYRVSFFGGGTDYPSWYRNNPGAVLATSIDKYCYLTVRWLPPFFEHKYFISYREIETPQEVNEIKHPAVRETLKFLQITKGISVYHAGDLPARAGMGTSSSFTVGLIKAIKLLQGISITKLELTEDAIHVEQSLIKENVGSQDQTTASFGGFNKISFFKDKIIVSPIFGGDKLKQYLMLFFTGFSRTASQVAVEQLNRIKENKSILEEMYNLVDKGIYELNNSHFDEFGKLLGYNWSLKRKLSNKITTDYIDFLYDKTIQAGALGGKLLGAGGGGFLLVFADPDKHNYIKKVLGNLLFVPFKFENEGSQVIFNNEI